MATTYKKKQKSIVISTIGGATINASDTATAPIASDAISAFEHFQIMSIKGQNDTTLVPFHAVDNIVVTDSLADVTKADAYGCEDSSEGDDSNDPNA